MNALINKQAKNWKISNQMVMMDFEKIVRTFIKHYNSFDVDKMCDLFTDDCIFENVNNSTGTIKCSGKNELKNMALQASNYFKTRKQTITNLILDKDKNKIAVEIDYEAILACDFPNGSKKGDLLRLKGISIYEFEGNKIKRLVDFS